MPPATLTVTAAVLESITVDPPDITVHVGVNSDVHRIGPVQRPHSKTLGAGVVWTCDKAEVATIVADTGIATAVASGTASITATFDGVLGSTTIIVTTDLVVSTVTPAEGASGVSVSEPIVVTFDNPIDPTTLIMQTEDGPAPARCSYRPGTTTSPTAWRSPSSQL